MGLKIKDIIKGAKIGSSFAKPFLPGVTGEIIDQVTDSLADSRDPGNEGAIRTLTGAVEQLVEVVAVQETRIRELESKLQRQ